MSTLTTHTTASRDSHSIGLCKFNTTTKAIEVSDGTNWLAYDYDSIVGFNDYSMSFDGSNDKLVLGSRITVSGSKTLSFWAKFNSFNATTQECLFSSASSSYNYWFLTSSSGSTPAVYLSNGQAMSGFTGWNTSDWFHVALVGDGTNLTAYVDGGNATTGLTDYNFDFDWFGASTRSSGLFFYGGLLDEVAVWDRALSQTEIQEIAQNPNLSLLANGNSYSASNLLHYYRMGDNDSGSTTTVSDNKGTNDITINGATPVSGTGNTPS